MSESLVRVINLKLSDKLQKYGYHVLEITGGQILSQPMSHWYDLSADEIKEMADSDGKAIFNADEINQLIPEKKVDKTIESKKDVLKTFASKRTRIDDDVSFKDKVLSGGVKDESPDNNDGE